MATAFTSTLSPGFSGPQVKALQQWLNANGFPVNPSGQPGGPGTETEYFGAATLAALQKFQAANGLVSSGDPASTGYGNFGPQTMAKVNQMIQETPTQVPESPAPYMPTSANDYTVAPANRITNPSGTAVFSNGRDALVTFAGEGATPNQIFLVDQENKQVIPFSSMRSAINYFSRVSGAPVTAGDINAVLSEIPSSTLSQGGSLEGFFPVNMENGFNEDGHLLNPAPSNANIQARYGKDVDRDEEVKQYKLLDGFVKLLSSGAAGKSNVTPAELAKLTSSDTTMAFYINALTYGGYSLQDVYQDMVRQQYVDNGQGSTVMNAQPISSSQPASVYKASSNYRYVQNNPALQVTPTIAGIDASILNTPAFSLPDEAFNLINPLNNPNSPEFRTAMEEYKSATYDIALEIAQATNESDHTRALSDWNSLRQEIQERLGITLSDNAIQAWNQIENFQAQAGQAGLSGSGIVQQKIDDFLRQQQGVNEQMRKYYSSYQDRQKEFYYQNYASPDEIKALIASDPQRAQAWGLVPSSETKQYMTLGNLQSLFPGTPTSDLQMMLAKYLDPSGNFYSKLYGNYAANQFSTKENYMAYQAGKVITKSENEVGRALTEYSDPNNPFLKPSGEGLPTPKVPSMGTERTPTAAKAMEAIQRSASNLGSTSQKPQTQPPTTPQTAPTQSIPRVPTPPPGMNAQQQSAWDAAVALIPKPAATTTSGTPHDYSKDVSVAPTGGKSTTPTGVLAPPKLAPGPINPWSLQSFGGTLRKAFGF